MKEQGTSIENQRDIRPLGLVVINFKEFGQVMFYSNIGS